MSCKPGGVGGVLSRVFVFTSRISSTCSISELLCDKIITRKDRVILLPNDVKRCSSNLAVSGFYQRIDCDSVKSENYQRTKKCDYAFRFATTLFASSTLHI